MNTLYLAFRNLNFRIGIIAAMILFGVPQLAMAQVRVPFTQRTSQYTPTKTIYNIKGDFMMIGNTNLTLVNYGANTSNSENMEYVDVDNDANTFNSSSATLALSTENGANPNCSNIIYAGLYWTGRAHDGTSANTFNVTKTVAVPSPVNNNYTVSNGGTITNTLYTMSVSRQGNNDLYYVRYTFNLGGTNYYFEFRNASPYVYHGTNTGSLTAATNVSTSNNTNTRTATFDPISIYSATGGLTITVNSLVRDSRTNRNEGQYQSSSSASGNVSGTVYTNTSVTKTFDKSVVQLKHASETSYTTVSASDANFTQSIYYPGSTDGYMYSAYAEVTDYVKAHGIGAYTVADIALREGDGGGTGYYGGWGLVVVYENSKMKWRDVTIFDGHAYVYDESGSDVMTYKELSVSGFKSAQTGHVKLKYGVMAGEGDMYLGSGAHVDNFSIDRYTAGDNWVALSSSDGSNTSENFFNSRISTGNNPRNPNLVNTTGLDIKMDTIPNAGNSIITNNQTSTRFRYGTNQDTYIIFCIGMAVDAYIPEPEGEVSITGGISGGSGSMTVLPGGEIEYSLKIRNLGSEVINNASITIPIPYTCSFVSCSGVKNPGTAPSAPEYLASTGANGSIVWQMGDLILPTDPNQVLATLTYRLKVTTDCFILSNPNCSPVVSMSGSLSGVGATSGTSFSCLSIIQGHETDGQCVGEPITEPLTVTIDRDAYVAANCNGGVGYETQAFTYCNLSGTTVPFTDVNGHFPGGSRFYSAVPTGTNTPTEYTVSTGFPGSIGTTTYYAVPPGNTACYWRFTIAVTAITSRPTASPVSYCLGDVAVALTATPTNPSYPLYYYNSSTDVTPKTSITPSTASVGTVTYYVAEGLSNQCISPNRTPIVVTVNSLPTVAIASTKNVTCPGGSDGEIVVSATGSGMLQYSKDGGTTYQASNTFSGLSAGDYTVTVKNDAGCTASTNVTIADGTDTEPPVLSGCPTSDTKLSGCDESAITVANTGFVYSASPVTIPYTSLSSLGVTATDNCSSDNDFTAKYQDSKSGTCPIVVTRVFTVTDLSGKSNSCSQTITISQPDFTANMPTPGVSTVNCLVDAQVQPVPPVIKDFCGNDITATLKTTPANILCAGDMVWVFTYTDCEGNAHDWVYTYTIEREDFTMPANAGTTVACVADIEAPTVPEVKDNCGNVLTASAPVISEAPVCEGTVTYTYTFTDCEKNTHDWVYT
ncbi:MAG: hypothetical protein ACK5JD_10635, partial [Mangrovibacterium sp.]